MTHINLLAGRVEDPADWWEVPLAVLNDPSSRFTSSMFEEERHALAVAVIGFICTRHWGPDSAIHEDTCGHCRQDRRV